MSIKAIPPFRTLVVLSIDAVMTAVSVACLTIYVMLNASDRAMVIEGITLLEKSGGASGDYRR